MNPSEKRIILLDLIYATICCKLDREQNGHSGFSDWYDTNSQAIDEVVTHEVVTEYFALKGEGKHILSKQLSQRIIERMKIAA
ncbi:MAG: hypothetical protein KBD19_00555 [Candidatus Moranbacteria bacterium]|nr:hypothetical protein [Candidatus Moranbacteria bacterium]